MYTIYDLATGAILRNVSCSPLRIAAQIQVGEGYVAGQSDDITQYVDEIIVDKANIFCIIDKLEVVSDGVDKCTLSFLPNPCSINIKGEGVSVQEVVYGGTETITFDTDGVYTIELVAFPYIDKEYIINAN